MDRKVIQKGIDYYPVAEFNYKEIRAYLDNIKKWKNGTKSDGSEIKRAQLWFDMQGRYFSNEWRNLDLDRWRSGVYDSFLLSLQEEVQKWVDAKPRIPDLEINSLLINKYRNGDDYIKKHRDSLVFGENPTIINMSIGGSRDIVFTDKYNKETRITLESGSILVMHGDSQHKYVHEIQRSKTQNELRYSMTWRQKIR